LENIKGWLVKNVHRHGDLYDPAELIKKITGKKLDAKPYLEYLEEKHSALYGL
jgi:carboxypeptidase Taq